MREDRSFRSAVLIASFVIATFTTASAMAGGASDCETGKREQASRRTTAARLVDDATGRDLRNFPPDPVVDFLHMKLQMRFDDLNQKKFTAVETLSFTPIGRAASALVLDAVNLKIGAVKLEGNGARVEFSTDDKRLSLRFDPPLPAGQKQDVVIEYACDHPVDGMFFTPASAAAPAYTAEVHTQGEADTNRYWFVCHDFPNDRMSTEIIADVPATFSVLSNGRLISNLTTGDRAVWHWLQDKPHVSYLVTLVIGNFDVVEIPHERVPMHVWVPQGEGELVQQTYGRTGEMIDMFEKCFGVPYPWDKYDQVLAKNFGAGGMENTSATTMYPTALLDKTALLDGDLDGLISHELCHQWTGDYITCRTWAHIWLNEGWASFGNDLWDEHRFGADGYLDAIRDEFGVARRDRTGSNDTPMVSPVYDDPDDTFGRIANPYPKGASILHMLRMLLGDDVFWKGVRLYFQQHGLGLAETSDFRYAMEQASGRSLEWFFEQWCYRPGTPELNVKSEYDAAKRAITITVVQEQKIDGDTPAFRFTLPVAVRAAGAERTLMIEVDRKTTTFTAPLDAAPIAVAVDPNLWVLKTMKEEKPMAWWEEQARSGPTIVARHEALQAIGGQDSADHINLLKSVIQDDKERYTLRNTAVDALAQYASPEARRVMLELASGGVAEARVRVNLVRRLANAERGAAMEALARYAENDASYAVRAAAIGALAEQRAKEQIETIANLVDFESRNDEVRNAALRALADLDDARGLDYAIKYAAYGYHDRSRPTAIGVIGRLASHDKDRAVEFLLKLLDDPEERSVSAAGAALAEIGDRRAEARLSAMTESAPNPEMRQRAKGWLEALRKKN